MSASPTNGGTAGMLDKERAKCSFNVSKLMEIMGTDKRQQQRENARKYFKTHPLFAKDDMQDYMSYEERYKAQLAQAAAAIQLTRDNPRFMMQHMSGQIQMADMYSTNGIGIHFFMFLTFLKSNASQEQKEKWLEPALEGKFLGCYCQTELGHGSNLRGIETIATFDKETDEFVIHSPTLTSLKWWPTGMYATTHAVVMANLILDGKPCGVNGFLMQLRDENGDLLPGIEVGEMGPKIDHGRTNIGYARFTHVRIPRFNMFSKLFKVTREGKYVAPPPTLGRFQNISMMEVRMFIVGGSSNSLGKAATIATRYSCVRKQGFKDTTAMSGPGAPEFTIMDYRMQQYRVFSALALSYSIRWAYVFIRGYLDRVAKAINAGDHSAADELPELHASLSGLKAWSTIIAHGHMEDLRKACGGQGFLRSSGMPTIVEEFCDPATVEGEQVIMSLQCSRFLCKSVQQRKKGQEVKGTVKYLEDTPWTALPFTSWAEATPEDLVGMFRERARRQAIRLEERFTAEMRSNNGHFTEATNATATHGYKAAGCHSAYITISRNLDAINDLVRPVDRNVYAALLNLMQLTALVQIKDDLADWIPLITPALADSIMDQIHVLLDRIRPDAVGLVDALGFEDDLLKSTIGKFDGNVYEAIYDQAKLSPLNQTSKMVGWETISKVLDLDFLKRGIGQRQSPNQSKL
eukprot:GFYU01001790.1.p1 GENE.GFYU01001790.1~~GFYU01001790.1.p1  ORF type:complete len:712 (-),score=194.63 GFYU01001790.1:179-2251(-)